MQMNLSKCKGNVKSLLLVNRLWLRYSQTKLFSILTEIQWWFPISLSNQIPYIKPPNLIYSEMLKTLENFYVG